MALSDTSLNGLAGTSPASAFHTASSDSDGGRATGVGLAGASPARGSAAGAASPMVGMASRAGTALGRPAPDRAVAAEQRLATRELQVKAHRRADGLLRLGEDEDAIADDVA